MLISVIIPTYNEEHDIAGTLDALIAQDYKDKEILVLDDSTDNTPEVVNGYSDRGVVLVRPGGGGRCEARNKGIQMAMGTIVCVLNADVRPQNDFLTRIAEHYESGADYVLVQSRISNLNSLLARYISCGHDARFLFDPENIPYDKLENIEWTEGFSCRRDLAIKAGLFPVGYPVPICAGEDGFFGKRLRECGAKKIIDFSIVVNHVAPESLSEYWYIRSGRGKGSPQIRRFLHKWSFSRIMLWATLRVARTLVFTGLVFPMLIICRRFSNKSPQGNRDLLPFCWAWLVEQIAFHVGEWKSIFEIRDAERKLGNVS